MASNTHTLYADESGRPDYPQFEPSDSYHAVGGIVVDEDHLERAKKVLTNFKTTQLGSAEVILRYSDVVGAKGPFGPAFRDKVRRDTFLSEFFDKALQRFNWRALVGVIDKRAYLRTYGTRPIDRFLPQDPYLVAFTFVIERFVTFLRQEKAKGRIVFESRNPRQNAYLQWEYSMMHVAGTQFVRASLFNEKLPTGIVFAEKSDGEIGLELADMVVGTTRHRVADPDGPTAGWGALEQGYWRGTNPNEPGQVGLKVFPGNLARELLGHHLDQGQGQQ